jgi:metallophosphoesterase superfamily enzyme
MLIEQEWLLTPERIAVHVPTSTAVLADLHLGYHAARQRRGEATPEPSLNDILAPLAAVLQQHAVTRLVVAGDLFEDGLNEAIADQFNNWLRGHRIQFIAIVPGNHDRNLAKCPVPFPLFAGGFQIERWQVVHGDKRLPSGPTVSGHWHPALFALGRYHPCFLWKPGRLILPAFSRDARGINLARSRGWEHYRCLTPVGNEVLDFGHLKNLNATQQA